jgi:hypothetical protein
LALLISISGFSQTNKLKMCNEAFYSEQRNSMTFLINNPNEIDSLVIQASIISPNVNKMVEKMNAVGEEIKQSKKILLNSWRLSAGTGFDFINSMDDSGQRINIGVSLDPKKLFLSGSERRRLEHMQKFLFHEKEEYQNKLRKLIYDVLFERLMLLEEMALNHDFLDESEQYYNLLKEDYKSGSIEYKTLRIGEKNYGSLKLEYHKSEHRYNQKTIEFNNIIGSN